ncbi:hypothetical protein HOD29_04515 [archaeon]|jgi:NOL1/NOP2/fmu family ribosome biogenesis protein|nr:hypothetical protein [archaeon]
MNPRIKIFNAKETRKVLRALNQQFGIEEIPGQLIRKGEEKLFLFQGNLDKETIKALEEFTPIERAGVYVAKEVGDVLRLSIEGSQIFKDQITKNVVELTEEEKETWMMGYEVEKKTGLRDFVIIKYKDEMLGTGRASEEKITNFIPKSRRLKDKNIEN